ncbi:hypothetical protein MMC25_006336 [Agyrium rufum]|nr:hypothetical protein [Agyrium rufum]
MAVKGPGALFIGSVPLATNEVVFRTLAENHGQQLRRIPDGETGERHNFVIWQSKVFEPTPSITRAKSEYELPIVEDTNFEPKAEDVKLNPTHFDDAAIESYRVFRRLKDECVIPKETRFQVSLPTPIIVLAVWIQDNSKAVVEPLYEKLLLDAVAQIQAEIPHEELAIQWDVAAEFGMLEDLGWLFTPWFPNVQAGIIERMQRLSAVIAPDVELGYHLCYGDIMHKHFTEPKDASKLVEMANLLTKKVDHPIAWIHMPVPKDRLDREYYAPLRGLELDEKTELYLGVVHADDLEGTKKRIGVAKEVVPGLEFGFASECGLGRTPVEQIKSILEITAAVSGAVV